MKSREVLYDEIITEYAGTNFTHGEVRYLNLRNDGDEKYLSSVIDCKLCIKEVEKDSFIKELSILIEKYAN